MELANSYKGSALQRSGQTDDKVVSLTTMFQDSASPAASLQPVPAPQRDFSGSLQIVQEVAEAMRISDARVHELEGELRQFHGQATDEINRLKIQLEQREVELQRLQQRLRETEERAVQAEGGLAKLNEAIKGSFMPLLREFEARKQSLAPAAS